MIELKQAHPPITMAIVSTNQLVRLGLQAVIKSRAHIRLIGESMGVIGAEDVIAREKPDILLVEMAGKIDILEWIQKIKISIPSMKIILLSGVEETHSTWQALSSGIDGIVLSIQPTAALLATIDYVCDKPAKAVLDEGKGTNPLDGTACALATACPSSSKDIAGRLCICSTTISSATWN